MQSSRVNHQGDKQESKATSESSREKNSSEPKASIDSSVNKTDQEDSEQESKIIGGLTIEKDTSGSKILAKINEHVREHKLGPTAKVLLLKKFYPDMNGDKKAEQILAEALINSASINNETGMLIETGEFKTDNPAIKSLQFYKRAAALKNPASIARLKFHELANKNATDLSQSVTVISKINFEFKNPDESKLDRLDENYLGEISKGSYGKVLKGKWYNNLYSDDDYEIVAVKMPLNFGDERDIESLYNEFRVLSKNLHHPNVVHFHGGAIDYPMIVMEFLHGGTLENYLETHLTATWAERFPKALGCAKAVMFLHENYVIHHDIKPKNFLLDKNGEPKLCDFGEARIAGEDKGTNKEGGTPTYLPLEKLDVNSKIPVTNAADIFSLGIVLWEIGTNLEPPLIDVKDMLKGARPIFSSKSENYPECYATLFSQCWDNDPEKRPSAKEVVRRLEGMRPA